MRIKKTSLLAIMAGLLAFPVVVSAAPDNPPGIPLFVYGDVSINNSVAPVDTTISVLNNGEKVATTSVEEKGKYYLEVPAENKGGMLVYKVNGLKATEAECLNPMETSKQNLDLSITTTEENNDNDGTGDDNSGDSNSNSSGGNTDDSNNTDTSGSSNDSIDTSDVVNSPSIPTDDQNNSQDTFSQQKDQKSEQSDDQKVLGEKVVDERAQQLNQILEDASVVYEGNVSLVLGNVGKKRNLDKETAFMDKYVLPLIKEAGGKTDANISALNNFIVYGTQSTLDLGAGERTGVVNSYRAAFGKLPSNETGWQDVIKIANGRWPSGRSEKAEDRAQEIFKEIYKREANMDNPNDNAAVTIMAYGLRPDNRNTDSEAAAIKTFEAIYGQSPDSATEWDTVRAIAYSGAQR